MTEILKYRGSRAHYEDLAAKNDVRLGISVEIRVRIPMRRGDFRDRTLCRTKRQNAESRICRERERAHDSRHRDLNFCAITRRP